MSDIKSILLHFDASPHCAARLQVARALAARLDATITAMFAATPSAVESPRHLAEGSSLIVSGRADDAQRLVHARQTFEAQRPGPEVSWAELRSSDVVAGFVHEALLRDLTIVGQHNPKDAASHVPADFAESLVTESGRPVLVVPFAGSFAEVGSTVLVAWKPTREAGRALSAALPLLRRAQHTHVASWGCDPRELEPMLLRHGIEATFHSEGAASAHAGNQILSRCADLSADLLVMGCYGHSRARELVLGGASRTVMKSMTLPVLIAH